MSKILSIHFNADAKTAGPAIGRGFMAEPGGLKSMLSLPEETSLAEGLSKEELDFASRTTAGWTTEAAARHHLQVLLVNQDSERLAELTSPERPEVIPDMKLENNEEMPLMDTQRVTFQQTAYSLPIFGTRAVVEIERGTRRLSAVDGLVTYVPDIPAIPKLGPADALYKLTGHLGKTEAELALKEPPALCFYPLQADDAAGGDEASREVKWKLAYHFRKVPVAPPSSLQPPEPEAEVPCGCCGAMSEPFGPMPHDYLVDANDGSLLLFYPSGGFFDIPVRCSCTDTAGNTFDFEGLQLDQGTFEMTDPLRSLQTLDASFADIHGNPLAGNPVTHSSTVFPASAATAAQAHILSSQVYDFFKHVLQRNGVDNKGMKLISVVNCYSSDRNPQAPPLWANAQWSSGRMWYGTLQNGGPPVSAARYLDVMAHELAHGVTQTTANLIYRGQSGALNESFSDIFGILIKNWYPGQPNPLAGWSWDIGEGWRGGSTVLRSVKDPTLGGQAIWPQGPAQPAHMNDYYNGQGDNGGVHINSGIHNRAFHNVATAMDAEGIHAQEVALLYYVTLTRLAPMSRFSDCRRTLLNVAAQRYQGSPALQATLLAAIGKAYDDVGIV